MVGGGNRDGRLGRHADDLWKSKELPLKAVLSSTSWH